MPSKYYTLIQSIVVLMYLFISMFGLTSCVSSKIELTFINDLNIPSSSLVAGTRFGGISGITYLPDHQTFVGISDDKSEFSPARLYQFNSNYEHERLSLSPASSIMLSRDENIPFAKGQIDGEGIALYKGRVLYLSSEGDGKANPRLPPAIYVCDLQGRILSQIQLPAKYIPNETGPLTRGITHNGGFEGLSISPSQNFLFALLESPLAQDDTLADFTKGSYNRGLILKFGDNGFPEIAREFIYAVSPLTRDSPQVSSGGNGVSEILAISDHELLVLERGGTVNPDGVWTTQAKLFHVDINERPDPSAENSSGNMAKYALTKTLVLDFDSIRSQLSPGFQTIDNLEGMAFGPKDDQGRDSLIFVSDDNFSDKQRTQILHFKLSRHR